jgi:YfiH family protein
VADELKWRKVQLGTERVLLGRLGPVVFGFGIGPAIGGGPTSERVERLLDVWPGERLQGRWCRQVHGTDLWRLDQGAHFERVECGGERDGLVTKDWGTAVFVWTADCVPVLFAGQGVVAAVHAGWRGLAAGVLAHALRVLSHAQEENARQLTACIGPAVGPCHYEIDEPVITALSASGVPRDVWLTSRKADLRELARNQLIAEGVDPSGIHLVGGCTACDPDLASFRRDGKRAGRQPSFVFRELETAPLS